MSFELASDYQPRGDQGRAIAGLTRSLLAGNRHQTLLGVTGSGKTFTVANVIRDIDRPTLIMSHNKTLAAQLYSEFKQFFPRNAVEYFVSYFDYYQPEAYIPRSDTYIEKDSSINEEIERLRLGREFAPHATGHDRGGQRVVYLRFGVSGGFPPDARHGPTGPADDPGGVSFETGGDALRAERYRIRPGKFRVRGDVVEVHPAQVENEAVRVEFFGDEIDRISVFDPLTGHVEATLTTFTLFPAKQFVTPHDKLNHAMRAIREELDARVVEFERESKFIEAQRIKMRTEFDLEMMQEMGFCNGIENYSRHLSGRPPGSRPYTLMDFLPEDTLLVIDESHATVPQIGGMFAGDRSRKKVLVDYGFRLPSALDNRPLNFEEFMQITRQIIYVSATPGDFEIRNSVVGNSTWIPSEDKSFREGRAPKRPSRLEAKAEPPEVDVHSPGSPLVVEQIIRPTGLLDPKITIRPLSGQIDATIELCRARIESGERVLVTTLTKRTAEDLADYLRDIGLKVRYLHSDIDTIERVEILRSLRAGECDVLIGINLLREGLDLPEVSLVCILDADKEGYLRSQTSLIQTAGRAARHVNGEVVLFADTITGSMQALLDVSEYRRNRQVAYNEAHGIVPQSVRRAVQESLHVRLKAREVEQSIVREDAGAFDLNELVRELERDMATAAANLEYEKAALLRDQILELKNGAGVTKIEPRSKPYPKPSRKRRA